MGDLSNLEVEEKALYRNLFTALDNAELNSEFSTCRGNLNTKCGNAALHVKCAKCCNGTPYSNANNANRAGKFTVGQRVQVRTTGDEAKVERVDMKADPPRYTVCVLATGHKVDIGEPFLEAVPCGAGEGNGQKKPTRA